MDGHSPTASEGGKVEGRTGVAPTHSFVHRFPFHKSLLHGGERGGGGWCCAVWCGVVWCGEVWCAKGVVTKWQWPGWLHMGSANREGCVARHTVRTCDGARVLPIISSLSSRRPWGFLAAPPVGAVVVPATPTP